MHADDVMELVDAYFPDIIENEGDEDIEGHVTSRPGANHQSSRYGYVLPSTFMAEHHRHAARINQVQEWISSSVNVFNYDNYAR